MSKTIPIWTCVLNCAIFNYLNKKHALDIDAGMDPDSVNWDCSLHLPLWVSQTEKAAIENQLEDWTKQLESCGADIPSLASSLRKPLRPLWISQKTVIWLNEVPDSDSWDFTPIILVSASSSNGVFQCKTTSEFSWNYIAGAGDDEESWARGLSPNLFWNNAYDIISSGPDLCNKNVAGIVEKNRVYHAQRGHITTQITVTPLKLLKDTDDFTDNEELPLHFGTEQFTEESTIFWLGSTNIAVGPTRLAENGFNVDCILNCSQELVSGCLKNHERYLHLPIVSSKFDRFSLLSNLASAVNFAKFNLIREKTLLVCCHNGEDISICVALAILTSLFDSGGSFDSGKSFSETCITKWEMRRRLVFICNFAINARPSRGNLKQVFNFLNGGRSSLVS